MINWKNTSENLVIVIAVMFATAFITNRVTLYSALEASKTTAKSFVPAIEKAIDKETIKNEISNDISLEIDKIKKSDSLMIFIDQTPVNNQKPKSVINKAQTAKGCPDGSVCIPIENLTRRQKKRLKL